MFRLTRRQIRYLVRHLAAGILLCPLLPTLVLADPQLPGRVVRIVDGDSLMLDVRGGRFLVDLDGIDAPELNQPWGDAAADSLYHSLVGAFVVVELQSQGHGRQVRGRITFKGRDVALDLLHDGLAWSTVGVVQDPVGVADPKTEHAPASNQEQGQEHPYTRAERDAREAGRGLWSDPAATPPWEWRRSGATRR